jgi:membrane-associated phospholipid phosphatase
MISSLRKAFPVLASVLLLLQGLVFSQNLDIKILRDINLHRNRSLDNSFLAFTNSANYVSAGVPLVMLGVGLLQKDSTAIRNGLLIGASLLTAASISTLLKYSLDRPRPFVTYPDIQKCADGGSPSFPSGHTSDAFAMATSVSLVHPKWYIIAPAFIWAGAVGYSRMDLGVHYPSDVLVGAFVGAGSAYLCHVINKRLNPLSFYKKKGK